MSQSRKLSDRESNDILLDPLDFKLVLAKYYLEKIDSITHLDYDWNHFVLESTAESFVFYANLAIEILAFQINNEFHLIPDDKYDTQMIEENSQTHMWQEGERHSGGLFFDRLTIYNIKNALSTSDTRQKNILDIINKYFQRPQKTSTEWDLSNSKLWLLRELRNHIAHFQLFNRHAIAGGPTYFLFRFKVKTPDRRNGTPGIKLGMIESNPQDYFSDLFHELITFVKEVRNIVPYKHQSLRHNNPINFEL